MFMVTQDFKVSLRFKNHVVSAYGIMLVFSKGSPITKARMGVFFFLIYF